MPKPITPEEPVKRKPLAPLIFPAITAIIAALVSASVSYYVANLNVKAEENITKQKMFHELITELGKGGESGKDHYSLLALWKIYPQDHRLIVITALQDPNAEKIRLLAQIGFGDKLKPFEKDILKVYTHASIEDRQYISQLFETIDSTQHVDVLLDKLLTLNDISVNDPSLSELITLAKSGGNKAARVESYYSSLPPEKLRLRIAISHALYLADRKVEFKSLLAEFKSNITHFPELASFLSDTNQSVPISAKSILDTNDASTLVQLVQNHTQYIIENKGDHTLLQKSLDILSFYFNATEKSKADIDAYVSTLMLISDYDLKKAVSNPLNPFFHYQDKVVQLLLKEEQEAAAKQVFTTALVCAGNEKAQKNFFRRLRSRKRLFLDLDSENFEAVLNHVTELQRSNQWSCDESI